MVADGPDAADDWIAEHVGDGDIVVTADIPLAARCLKAGARAIGPTGKPFTEGGIGMALAMRDLSRHLRETGESKGYNASFTRKPTAPASCRRWRERSSSRCDGRRRRVSATDRKQRYRAAA